MWVGHVAELWVATNGLKPVESLGRRWLFCGLLHGIINLLYYVLSSFPNQSWYLMLAHEAWGNLSSGHFFLYNSKLNLRWKLVPTNFCYYVYSSRPPPPTWFVRTPWRKEIRDGKLTGCDTHREWLGTNFRGNMCEPGLSVQGVASTRQIQERVSAVSCWFRTHRLSWEL